LTYLTSILYTQKRAQWIRIIPYFYDTTILASKV